ncbi:MAG: MBL fold metallo-hydrolase [Deltaproteobacteria bacterium]|nr:MBL fold metallo-hydrolase [Deltaproteobacteria bacterium]
MSTLQITHLGHGTNLLQIQGQNFLTDPVFSEKVFMFFKRRKPAGLAPETLPPLSAILVSHAHYDHLDIFSYKYFKTTIPILVPKGLGGVVRKFLPNPVVEIPAGGKHQHQGVEIHALPVQHRGCRWVPIRHRAATAYLLKAPEGCVYFCGDSGYGPHFKKAGETFPIDVALLPIGGYHPRWWLKRQKMTPEEALQAFEDLQAKRMVPINWGVFDFWRENPEEAWKRLEAEVGKKGLAAKVRLLLPGESLNPEAR